MIVAHRGASRQAPPNTIPAFKLAWELGADAIEGDFHLTADDQIVCIHDESIKTAANTDLVICKSTLADLSSVDVGVWAGKPTRIPTISEVFSTIPQQKQIYIEIKCGAEIIPALLRAIETSGLRQEQVVIISFQATVLQALKALAPQHKVFWLCRFHQPKTGATTPSLDVVLNTLKAIQADGLSSNPAAPHCVIEAVIQQGYEWHVWTVNNPAEARRMIALGASSITTDVPEQMVRRVEQSSAGDRLKAAPEVNKGG